VSSPFIHLSSDRMDVAAAHVEAKGEEVLSEGRANAAAQNNNEDETPKKRQRVDDATVSPASIAPPTAIQLCKRSFESPCLCGACGKQSTCVTPAPATVTPTPTQKKRESYLSWDSYFMSVAFLSAMRSKDPSTQVGACIVSTDNKIVGIGYNGFPHGCSDDTLPWAREAPDWLDTKYPYVCHAELNAILNKNASDLRGCRIYVALFPCNECAKLIVQSGIREVVYLGDKYKHTPTMMASRRMLEMAGLAVRQFTPASSKLVIDFDSIN